MGLRRVVESFDLGQIWPMRDSDADSKTARDDPGFLHVAINANSATQAVHRITDPQDNPARFQAAALCQRWRQESPPGQLCPRVGLSTPSGDETYVAREVTLHEELKVASNCHHALPHRKARNT